MLLDPDPAYPIGIRIQDSQMNADPCVSGSTTLVKNMSLKQDKDGNDRFESTIIAAYHYEND
jgi:hypothetical protein